ncbi:MAG: hypothetical protein ACYC6Y_05630, partial [Thermoguttaceae bacterium]
RPLDLRTGDVDRPTSGRLLGEVTITSPGRSAGPEDDLEIATRDVQLTADRISTTNVVRFRHGASFGTGRNLVIRLQHDEETPVSPGEPPKVKGIESFELLELEHLHLEPTTGDEPAAAAAVTAEGGVAAIDTRRPLEVNCQGPFRFDLVRQYARFERQVNVLQLNQQGPADQLNCEVLTLHFSRSRKGLVKLDGKTAPASLLDTDNTDLQLREIEATGNPVIVRAFSRDAEARGDTLIYDVQGESIELEGSDEVFLRQERSEIHARSIRYKSKGKGRLGEIFSQGPGWMKWQMPDRPGEEVYLEWGDRLQLEPFEDQHLATLNGGVKLDYSGAGGGSLTAERIDLWLDEVPAGPGREKLEIVPDRMLVQNQVKINSPDVFGNVNQLQVWFEQASGEASETSALSPGPVQETPAAASASAAPVPTAPPEQEKTPERRFRVRSDVAQARFLIRQKKAQLAEMMLDGKVALDEIPVVPTAELPMHVEGDRIQVFEGYDAAKTRISVIGRLAVFQGRGMTLSGTNINVNAATNHLNIDGSGIMKLPVDRSLKGEPLGRRDEITITWQKEMDFDGLVARFEEKVLARTRDQTLQTELLEVRFAEPMEFRNLQAKTSPKAELEQIACRGGVFMEGRTYENGNLPTAGAIGPAPTPGADGSAPKQASWEQFQAVELTIHRGTGAILARGPGRITTIRQKSGDLMAAMPGQALPSRNDAADDGKLVYLHVEFPQMMTGNTQLGQATFTQPVRCLYQEVDSWQARPDLHDPDSLGDSGILLTADRLTVAKAPAPTANDESLELEALGNVTAENATFTALADRMTYSQAKEWLILEGDGYAPAELSFQEFVGAPARRYSAGKVCFWPKTKDVKIVDGRTLQMDSLPAP